ncbi:ATP-grasp domain-containing protein [Phycicoccus flavus]|uniref:ATP-grasp domain-containing protein n=1 Tax=Phycicoccus flavus TaxID=2502783 RepID=UPI000FEB6F1D|nr:ATP-grasp domain-containing protein [Phycicoccus flavus]NHA66689.1 ATP-grasp domain-containing protein [Phycicoccus flavus]
MSGRTLLVLGAAAVQEDAVHAARALGLNVLVCARAADGPAAAAADEFLATDILDVDALERLMRERSVGLVYSVGSDLAMPVVGELAARLGVPALAPREVAATCNDKGAMRRALAGTPAALPFQELRAGEPVRRSVPLPCIVKPVDAQGQRGVSLVTDEDRFAAAVEAARAHSRTGGAIAERYVGGTEISVNGYLVDGSLVFVLASDRVVWPQYTGLIHKHVVPATTVSAGGPGTGRAVADLLAAVCARIGITQGPVYAQMKVEDGVPHVVEVTPRLDGCHMWQLIRLATGIDLLDVTLRHLVLDEPPAIGPAPAPHPVELEFVCQEPGSAAPVIEPLPGDLVTRSYYRPGDLVRPVNGRHEKIGYRVREVAPA